ncbi:MAG: SRPBCC domain-containing protein [Lewinellaceae bacterium]|nr:SRPBCC domain-containing protein [Lewinellaceae bacterium]
MNSPLFFAFTADKPTHTIHIKREFAARLSLVWDAFTKKEILDQWGAPGPWRCRTHSMEFAVGGRRLYAMYSPEGEEHWAVQDFTAITPMTNLQYISGFSDKDGNTHPDFYGSENNLNFSEANGITTLDMTIKYKSLAILEMMIEKGFREGFTMTLDNLDKLLATTS